MSYENLSRELLFMTSVTSVGAEWKTNNQLQFVLSRDNRYQ